MAASENMNPPTAMSFNSTACLNCPLTRYLEEVSALEADSGKAQVAAVMLSFFGFFRPDQETPEYQNLEGLMEMLAAEKYQELLEEIRKPCTQCSIVPDCLVKKIILKG